MPGHPQANPQFASGPLASAEPTWRSRISDYIALTKPRIISLLLLTTLAGMIIASGELPPVWLALATLAGGALMAGGANAMNSYLDREMDRHMSRTRLRPVAAGRIEPGRALVFALSLTLIAFVLLWAAVNPLSAVLAFAGFVIYVLLYTLWSKRTTPLGVLIGGLAGAVPPLVGWAAVRGSIEFDAFILYAIVAVWQVPHTWTLSLMLSKDYARAAVPVLPVVAGEALTRRWVWQSSTVLFAVSLLPFATGLGSPLYLAAAVILGGRFLWMAWTLEQSPERIKTVQLYKYSLLYLALLFIALSADRFLYVTVLR